MRFERGQFFFFRQLAERFVYLRRWAVVFERDLADVVVTAMFVKLKLFAFPYCFLLRSTLLLVRNCKYKVSVPFTLPLGATYDDQGQRRDVT